MWWPWSRRPTGPGRRPSALVAGLADDVAAALPAAQLGPGSSATGRPSGRMAARRPHAARSGGLHGARRRTGPRLRGARVLLLDDTYVSGARSQSAAAALQRAGARTVIGPLGRVLRPGRVARHADFLRQHVA